MNGVRRLVLLLGAALVLAACGGPVEPLGMSELQGTVYDPPGAVDPPQILAVAMLMLDESETGFLTAASFAELEPGTFLGLAATVAADGSFTMQLPTEEELPDGILVPAADAIWGVADAGCALTADPATARVSQAGPSLLPVPTLLGFTETGIALLVTGPTKLDGGGYEDGFLSWMYADTPVALATNDACASLDVELELRRGWNQVLWTRGTTVTLRDAADEEVLSTAAAF